MVKFWTRKSFFFVVVEGLNKIKGLKADVASVETNIVSISIGPFFYSFNAHDKILIWFFEQVYFEILEGSNITALKLGKIMEEHGILLMPDSSSRCYIFIKKKKKKQVVHKSWNRIISPYMWILRMKMILCRVRIVIHHQVSASDVQYTLSCIKVQHVTAYTLSFLLFYLKHFVK